MYSKRFNLFLVEDKLKFITFAGMLLGVVLILGNLLPGLHSSIIESNYADLINISLGLISGIFLVIIYFGYRLELFVSYIDVTFDDICIKKNLKKRRLNFNEIYSIRADQQVLIIEHGRELMHLDCKKLSDSDFLELRQFIKARIN